MKKYDKPAAPTPKATSIEIRSRARTLRSFYDTLFAVYGPQKWWPAQSSLEVVIGAFLTQNTSWRAAERSIVNLTERAILSLEGLRRVNEGELRSLIRPSGFMIRKAAAIKAFIAWLDSAYGGSIEALAERPSAEARRELLRLPGIGNETADTILLYALGHPAMVVDEYLRRIATRHRLAPTDAKYRELQQLAEMAFEETPPEELPAAANEFHALAVAVGKQHCRTQARCGRCPLAGFL